MTHKHSGCHSVWAAVLAIAVVVACAPGWAQVERSGGTPYRVDAPPAIGGETPVAVSETPPGPRPEPYGLTDEVYASFEFMSPAEAADVLLRVAGEAGINVDEVQSYEGLEPEAWQLKPLVSFAVYTPYAEFEPAPGIDPELARQGQAGPAYGGREFVIVQLDRQISLRERAGLFRMGLMQHRGAGNMGMVASIPQGTAPSFAALPYVRWVGRYLPAYKYPTTPLQYPNDNGTIYSIDPDSPQHRADLASLGIAIVNYEPTGKVYEVLMDTSLIPAVADLPWVYRVEKQGEREVSVVDFGALDSRNMVGARETLANGRTGAGAEIGVMDTGLAGWHPAFAGHIVAGSDTTDDDHGSGSGHGTHVSGIVMGIEESSPYGYDIRGVAPEANVYMKEFLDGIDTVFTLFDSHTDKISNSSWNWTYDSSYNSDSEKADLWVDNHGHMPVWSAGNSGPYTVRAPANAKNVLAAGAVSYTRGGDSGGIGNICDYSGRGPTPDGRLKPDLVAPGGDHVGYGYGMYEYGVVAPNALEGIDSNYPECRWPDDPYYIRLCGTSMAAPHVTGALALMEQWWPGMWTPANRALILANTIPMKDSSDSALAAYGDVDTGYGLLNAWSTNFRHPDDELDLANYWDYLTESDKNHYYYPVVSGSNHRLVICLAYNDDEGVESSSDALKHDLDLIVTTPGGSTYYAYAYKPPDVTSEGTVEKMIFNNPQEGTWTVHIRYSGAPGGTGWRSQLYMCSLKLISREPSLDLYMPYTNTAWMLPNTNFTFQPAVWNPTGYIVAASSIKSGNSSYIGGDINQTRYLGNLMTINSQFWPLFNLVAPGSTGTYGLTFTASCVNKGIPDDSSTLTVRVDGTDPWNPTLSGTPASGWTNSTSLTANWSGEGDSHSGVDGFGVWWSTGSYGPPSDYKDFEETVHSDTLTGAGENDYYYNLKTVDNAGNWTDGYVWYGPWRVDTTDPTNPTSLTSNPTTGWTNDITPTVYWSGESDSRSGVDGFGVFWNPGSPGFPSASKDFEETVHQDTLSGGTENDWYFSIRTVDNAGNWTDGYESIGPFRIDTTAPTAPSSFSSSPTVNTWTNDNTIQVSWSGESDSRSGVDGFSYLWSTGSADTPDTVKDAEETIHSVTSGALSDQNWYFHIRTRDNAGNWSGAAHYGPFKIDTVLPNDPTSFSSTPPVNTWTNDNTVQVNWSGESDARSGVDGFSFSFTTGASDVPDKVKDAEETVHTTTSSALADGLWYFHIRTVDNAGNWTSTAHYGPFRIDRTQPTNPTDFRSEPDIRVWTSTDRILVQWAGHDDNLSGVDGFSVEFSNVPDTAPDTVKDLEERETSIEVTHVADGEWWFHLRTVDNAGNWTKAVAHHGPILLDKASPTGWRNFSPTLTDDLTPDCTVEVRDLLSGLKVSPSTAQYRYSTDGGSTYSAWLAASVTGSNGTTAYQTITAASVPFNNTGNLNRIQFLISDMAGNTGTSSAYTVEIQTGVLVSSPVGFFNPLWNWFSIPYAPVGSADANGVLGFDVSNNLFRWNPVSKNLELYPDDFRDLEPGRGYTLRITSSVSVSYTGTPVDPIVYVPEEGVQWIGMPALGTMPQQDVVIYNNTTGQYRTVAEDYVDPDPWINTNWVYWDSTNRVAKILNYAGGGDDTLVREWYGYRIWAFHRDLYIIFGR